MVACNRIVMAGTGIRDLTEACIRVTVIRICFFLDVSRGGNKGNTGFVQVFSLIDWLDSDTNSLSWGRLG